MGKNQVTRTVPSSPNEEVERLAYQYYVDRGYQDGHDQEDWLRAEAEVKKQKTRKG